MVVSFLKFLRSHNLLLVARVASVCIPYNGSFLNVAIELVKLCEVTSSKYFQLCCANCSLHSCVDLLLAIIGHCNVSFLIYYNVVSLAK